MYTLGSGVAYLNVRNHYEMHVDPFLLDYFKGHLRRTGDDKSPKSRIIACLKLWRDT